MPQPVPKTVEIANPDGKVRVRKCGAFRASDPPPIPGSQNPQYKKTSPHRRDEQGRARRRRSRRCTTYVTDPLGTRLVKADAQGVPEEDCRNLPFGDGLNCFADPNGNGDADTSPPLHFTGKERDAETGEANGNDYFGARYFASGLRRFMTPDWSAKYDPVPYARLDNPQTLNLYAYVQNNPLTMRDPDGHQGGVDFGLPPSKPWDGWWSGADTMDGRNCALNPEDCDAGQPGYSDSGEQDAENRHASIIGKDFDPLGFAHDTVQWSWSGGSGTRDDNDRKYVAEAVGLTWAKMQEGGASA